MANACSHMLLEPRLERSFPFMKQRMAVKAFCPKSNLAGFDPHIGCGQCHPLPPAFTGDNL